MDDTNMTLPSQEDQSSQSSIDNLEGIDTIREDMQDLLNGDFDFKGTFAFNKTYTDAPNPGLQLDDLGIIGLPLNTREAEAVKTHCTPAPFGKGERTLVEKGVRDTWEMDASKVTFARKSWNQFISRVVRDVCEALGVNLEASRPRCELYKLLLYETGSHFLPHVYTEKVDGMFATVVVVLPSKFTGGAAHISHGGSSAVYDCSESSQFDTTVISWYTDVTHEIKPITSGYRLALSYNVIHTTQSLRPALSAKTDLVEKIRYILSLWELDREGEHSPEKIVYLLDHTYAKAGLKASVLKGIDAHKVAMLNTLCSEMGSGLGLASIECHMHGRAEDYGSDSSDRDSCHNDEEDSDQDIPSDWADPLEVEKDMSLTNLVDLEGTLISDELSYDPKVDTIPVDLTEFIDDGVCDDESYCYQGNHGGNLERWYRRTVLVIWPKRSHYDVVYDGYHGPGRALERVQAIQSATPTTDELELIDYLLYRASGSVVEFAGAVCDTALMWKDRMVWAEAVSACSHIGVALLPEQHTFSAIRLFGLEGTKPALSDMLTGDPHNETRLQFLSHLNHWAGELDDAMEKTQIQRWVLEKQSQTMETLKKPLKSEQKLLLAEVKSRGGVQYLNNQILSQLVSLADDDFLREFAQSVYTDPQFPASDEKTAAVSTLLSTAISKAAFFTPPQPKPTYSYYAPSRDPPVADDQSTTARLYVQAALDLHCEELVEAIIDRVTDTTSLLSDNVVACAQSVMLPLTAFFVNRARKEPSASLPSRFEHLQHTALKHYMDWLKGHPHSLTKEGIDTLLRASTGNGNPGTFVNLVWPGLASLNLSESVSQHLLQELRAKQDFFVFPPDHNGTTLQSIMARLAKPTVENANLNTPKHILSALSWCLEQWVPELSTVIAQRLYARISDKVYLKNVLIPSVPMLRMWAIRNKHNMDAVICTVVVRWTEDILGPAPAADVSLSTHVQNLAKWTCTCQGCGRAKAFLTKSEAKAIQLTYIGAPLRKHVEGHLATHARSLATWEMIRSTPQGLTIKKSDPLCQLVSWRNNQLQGKILLQNISSNDTELRRILGDEYDRVASALLGGSSVAQQTQPSAAAGPAAATTSGAGPSTHTAARAGLQATSVRANVPPAAKKRKVSHHTGGFIDLT